MDFSLTEEQIMIRDAARDFANNVLKPGVIERDEKQKFPHDEIKQMGELGFLGMMVDPKYGRRRNGYRFLCTCHGRDL